MGVRGGEGFRDGEVGVRVGFGGGFCGGLVFGGHCGGGGVVRRWSCSFGVAGGDG